MSEIDLASGREVPTLQGGISMMAVNYRVLLPAAAFVVMRSRDSAPCADGRGKRRDRTAQTPASARPRSRNREATRADS